MRSHTRRRDTVQQIRTEAVTYSKYSPCVRSERLLLFQGNALFFVNVVHVLRLRVLLRSVWLAVFKRSPARMRSQSSPFFRGPRRCPRSCLERRRWGEEGVVVLWVRVLGPSFLTRLFIMWAGLKNVLWSLSFRATVTPGVDERTLKRQC